MVCLTTEKADEIEVDRGIEGAELDREPCGFWVFEHDESGRMGILNPDFGAGSTDVPEMAGVKDEFADAGLDVEKAVPVLEVDSAGDGI